MSLNDLLNKADAALKTVGELGARIQDFNIGALPRMGAEALLSGKNPFSAQNDKRPSPYATDLSFFQYAPKPRFLFKVIFTFQAEYQGNFRTREFSFLVKKIDKPKVRFEYEEANFYNYRTKVLKRISYDPLNMIFIDDSENAVVDFFEYYRRAHSPITWKPFSAGNPRLLEMTGMDFQDGAARGLKPGYSASVGTLQGGHYHLLKDIKLIEYYAHGTLHNVYFFVNPRINQMDFDGGADHEEGQSGHGLNVSFDFDYLYVEKYRTFSNDYPFGKYDILDAGGSSALTNRLLDSIFGPTDQTIGSNRNIFTPQPGGVDFDNLPGMVSDSIGGMIKETALGGALTGLGKDLSSASSAIGRSITSSLNKMVDVAKVSAFKDLGG